MATKKKAAAKQKTAPAAGRCAVGHELVDGDRCRRAVNTGKVCEA